MKKLRVAVVHPWGGAKWADPLMWDGLHAALAFIGLKHKVDWYLGDDVPDDSYDWILPWGVASIPFNETIERYKAKKALFCAGHPHDIRNLEKFNAVFVESPGVLRQMRPYCTRIVLAFGTDTDFFKPTFERKMFDAFFPATFSTWKRQDLFAQAVGKRGLCCGTLQPDGKEAYNMCESLGTYTMVGLVPTSIVAKLYNMSRSVIITSWHGSERTALEAMATNIPLVVTEDNKLTCSLLTDECITVPPTGSHIREAFLEAITKKVHTRDYVIEKYSHYEYAKKILEVLEQ